MKKIVSAISSAAAAVALLAPLMASAAIGVPPGEDLPTSVGQCKKGGWKLFGDMFKNQGDCVSFVVTGGKNEPSGPPKN